MPTVGDRPGEEPPGGADLEVQANVMIAESRASGVTLIMGRVTYHLRLSAGELKMSYKKVVLINNDRPMPTMSFLL
jgi:hypothetical protein